MAREWSLLETKALVEEHIALKEEEKYEIRTASEHWNKVAKKLQEKGFNRSHKSCNKRWYKLEQYEVQIFSFNMEDGKHKNFWDLTRIERMEYRDKWPKLPSGDGIDKEIFGSFKRFSQQYEKTKIISETMDLASIVDKEVILTEPKVELTRQSVLLPTFIATQRSTLVPFSMVTSVELKQEEESIDSQKLAKIFLPTPIEVQQPLSSQDALDGFKLQARELRRRRATELRRNNRTVPYNNTHTTFMKSTPPLQLNTQNSPQVSETTSFGFVATVSSRDLTSHQNMQPTVNSTTLSKENVTHSKPPFQLKRPNPFTHQASQNNHHYVPTQLQHVGSNQVNFQSQILSANSKTTQQLGNKTFAKLHQGGQCMTLLQSINSHLPLLQVEDGHKSKLGSLEEQLQMILGVNHGPLQPVQHCEQQLHKSQNIDGHYGIQFCRNIHQENGNQGSTTASLLGVAIGGLGVQLGAIVKLMHAKHASEQEFQDKMLMFVECMVVSLHTMAQLLDGLFYVVWIALRILALYPTNP